MALTRITREDVLSRIHALPAFPRTVQRILDTVDDPESSMAVLANTVAQDPAIAARVFAAAHKAASNRQRAVNDIYAATAMVGMQTVREIALYFSMSRFLQALPGDQASAEMWRHSIAVGVCAQELARHLDSAVSVHHAFIAGLVHDIGQFWLLGDSADGCASCWAKVKSEGIDICQAEESIFGVNHTVLGSWLATAWELPPAITNAILWHHCPDAAAQGHPLVDLLHVAEVLSNALELNGHADVHVSYLSPRACQGLGLVWDDDIRPLFGRIDARSRYMGTFLGE